MLNGFLTGTGIDVANRVGIQPTLDLDFANQRYRMYDSATGGLSSVALASILTYTGANRTFVDATGVLRVQASNVPRLTFDPVTGASNGLSVFEAQTNLLIHSEEFDNAAWTKMRSSIASNAVDAPDGTITADKLTEDTSASNTHQVAATGPVTSSGATITLSLFAKSSEREEIAIQFAAAGAFTTPRSIRVNLANGSVISTTGSVIASSVNRLANNWYRISLSATADATGSAVATFNILVGGTTVYTGDGTSGLFLWGAQLEVGASATPYIPTTTAAVTAPADVASLTGTNFSKWFNPVEGTFVWQFQSASGARFGEANTRAFGVSDGNISNRIVGQGNNLLTTGLGLADGLAQSGSNRIGNAIRAGSYSSNQLAFSVSGSAVVTDSVFTLPAGLNQMVIGQNSPVTSGFETNGTIQRILYFPRALPANLQQLSA